MVAMGLIFKKLSYMSGLGIFDKLLGFLFGASKFFLIAAVIAYATYNIKSMRATMDSFSKNSFMFPILVEVGSVIMKLDPIEISDDINATIIKGKETIENNISETVKDSALEMLKATKDQINSAIDKNSSEEISK